MKKVLLVLVGIAGVCFGQGSVTVYNPDGSFNCATDTIQWGINACPDGGTVSCANGTYTGTGNKDLSWSGKHITVKSENGANNCIIDCQNSGRGFYFNNTGQNLSDVIDGFTIRNGYAPGDWPAGGGGGIHCKYSSSPSITNCTISGNSASWGGGISCHVNSSPTIINCTISNNTSGGGIYCYDSSSPTIINCTILGNSAKYGGGILCNSSSPSITNCTILGNSAIWSGGGIFYEDSSSPSITNCTISGNNATYGGGIHCVDDSSSSITNCIIQGNTATYGGGIDCVFSSPSITNCTILGNSANWYGGGIRCNSSSPSITNNIIVNNSYGIYRESGNPSINYNDVWNNSSGNYYNCSAGLNDISADPQFISQSDFHLQPISPCIDSGSNIAPAIPAKDKDGNPRIIRIVDMGAYEFTGDFLQIRFLFPTSGPMGTPVTIKGNTSATDTAVSIDFGDHQTITSIQSSINGTFSATFIVDSQTRGTKTITAISGQLCATTTFVLTGAVVVISKEILYGTPSGYTGGEQYVPGGTLTYIITYRNIGNGTATNTSIQDRISNYTYYAIGTLRMGTIASTYESAETRTDGQDGDSAEFINEVAIFRIGTVGIGKGGRCYFSVRIK